MTEIADELMGAIETAAVTPSGAGSATVEETGGATGPGGEPFSRGIIQVTTSIRSSARETLCTIALRFADNGNVLASDR
jgi:hypothetical protein